MNGVWTDNFENLKKGWVLGYFRHEVNPITATNGLLEGYPYLAGTTGSSNGFGISCLYPFFSVDTATPTVGDVSFTNSDSIFSSVATSNGNPTWNTDHFTKQTIFTRQKTSSGSITLNSWGLYAMVAIGSSSSSRTVLCYRELFDEPIIVSQYETIRLTFILKGYLDGTIIPSIG